MRTELIEGRWMRDRIIAQENHKRGERVVSGDREKECGAFLKVES